MFDNLAYQIAGGAVTLTGQLALPTVTVRGGVAGAGRGAGALTGVGDAGTAFEAMGIVL
jgi:hypothetical protein